MDGVVGHEEIAIIVDHGIHNQSVILAVARGVHDDIGSVVVVDIDQGDIVDAVTVKVIFVDDSRSVNVQCGRIFGHNRVDMIIIRLDGFCDGVGVAFRVAISIIIVLRHVMSGVAHIGPILLMLGIRHGIPFVAVIGAVHLAVPLEESARTHFVTSSGKSLVEAHVVVNAMGHGHIVSDKGFGIRLRFRFGFWLWFWFWFWFGFRFGFRQRFGFTRCRGQIGEQHASSGTGYTSTGGNTCSGQIAFLLAFEGILLLGGLLVHEVVLVTEGGIVELRFVVLTRIKHCLVAHNCQFFLLIFNYLLYC